MVCRTSLCGVATTLAWPSWKPRAVLGILNVSFHLGFLERKPRTKADASSCIVLSASFSTPILSPIRSMQEFAFFTIARKSMFHPIVPRRFLFSVLLRTFFYPVFTSRNCVNRWSCPSSIDVSDRRLKKKKAVVETVERTLIRMF